MTINGIDHINIRTLDVAGTVRFYVDILGLRYDGACQIDGFTRHWLRDAEGKAIIHLREMAPNVGGTGAVDHLALSGQNRLAVISCLEKAGVAFAEYGRPSSGMIQVFVTDPNGILLELTFAESDAA